MKKSRVCYIYSSEKANKISIEKVFGCIEQSLCDEIKISRIRVPEFRITPLKLIKNIFFCKYNAKKNKSDIYHITGDIQYIAIALPPEKTVLTIHDIVLLTRGNKLKRGFFKFFWFQIPIKRAKKITTISSKTYNDLVSLFPTYKNKIEIVENPLIWNYRFVPRDFVREIPVILQVGTRDNKNLIRVSEALNGFQCHLRIVGKLTEEQIETLRNNNINYSNVSDISETQLINEYENSDIVIFASTFEGFGLPIIEAQAVGRPVITSNISPMNDISGDGACLVDPFSVESIKEGIKKTLADDAYRKSIVNKGHENIYRFEPHHIAEKYKKIYDEIIAERYQ